MRQLPDDETWLAAYLDLHKLPADPLELDSAEWAKLKNSWRQRQYRQRQKIASPLWHKLVKAEVISREELQSLEAFAQKKLKHSILTDQGCRSIIRRTLAPLLKRASG